MCLRGRWALQTWSLPSILLFYKSNICTVLMSLVWHALSFGVWSTLPLPTSEGLPSRSGEPYLPCWPSLLLLVVIQYWLFLPAFLSWGLVGGSPLLSSHPYFPWLSLSHSRTFAEWAVPLCPQPPQGLQPGSQQGHILQSRQGEEVDTPLGPREATASQHRSQRPRKTKDLAFMHEN